MSNNHLEAILQLQKKILEAGGLKERLKVLFNEPLVRNFLDSHAAVRLYIEKASLKHAYIILAIIAIEQGPVILNPKKGMETEYHYHLEELAELLQPTEAFYDIIGGIIGYQATVLRLLKGEDLGPFRKDSVRYDVPEDIDIRSLNPEISAAILKAIEEYSTLAEIYVVGGAGDRLDLRDPITGEALPAAVLHFQGRSLLAGLIRDLQAREYLHYKLFHKQITTPIAMMTSEEKDNRRHILDICERHQWWGRPRDSFRIFSQPGGPVVTTSGDWSLKGPMMPTLKPGGHGVLWKLARDSGVFDWLEGKGISKLLIRQINNPVACTDHGILAFLGIGMTGNKAFGVASCDRLLNRPEGMSVLIETASDQGYDYRLSNVEYTEFFKRGIKDIAINKDSECSVFPANTNILFADIATIRDAIPQCPLPGLLINIKTTAPSLSADGTIIQVPVGRLETTMQNIADHISDRFDAPLRSGQQSQLRTFATYYTRRKTLSTTKNSFIPGESAVGSPEGTFHDVLSNYYELFVEHCDFSMPALGSCEASIRGPLPFLIQLHPAVGPLFSIIGQKIRHGSLSPGSEIQLEIAEVDIEDLHLDGSLLVLSDRVVGHEITGELSQYSEQTGKCSLHKVKIRNAGIDYSTSQPYWRNEIQRKESLTIILQGNGEFHASDVSFDGGQTIEVSDGERLEASAGPDGRVLLQRTKIRKPTWYWSYKIANNDEITLHKQRDHTHLTAVD
ncbi:MAG: hypothetical protein E6Q59_02510 [Nitrosomonas sp.]|nr:MAG: hypothetical protein E6Q59_02510 [Nitrosomonas sp.]